MSLRSHIVPVLVFVCLADAGCGPVLDPISSIIKWDRVSPSKENIQALPRHNAPISYEITRADEQLDYSEFCSALGTRYDFWERVWGGSGRVLAYVHCRLGHELPEMELDVLHLVLRDIFRQRGVLPEAIYAEQQRPENGTYLRVEIWREWLTALENMTDAQHNSLLLHEMTLCIAPLNHEWRYNVRYSVYIDNEVKQTSTYTISRHDSYSILFLPFLWLNFFTPSRVDAFNSTTYEFLLDAQRHGYLQGADESKEPTTK